MSGPQRAAVAAVLVFAAVLQLFQGASLEVPAVLLVAAVAVVFVPLARRRAERWALVIAALVVAFGGIAAVVRVADGISNDQVEFRGELDVREILRSFHPSPGDPLQRLERGEYGYISEAEAVTTKPEADAGTVALWAVVELAPWALAAIALALLAPVLRAAERGDPFSLPAARRLSTIGMLLLVGVPAIAIVRYIAAQAATGGTFVSPGADPVLTLSLLQLLPGLLVLALDGVFRRGAELRDFERHAI